MDMIALAVVALLLSYIVLFLVWKYTFRDWLFFVWLLLPFMFRGRISLMTSVWFMDMPYLGIIWAALAFAVITVPLALLNRERFRSLTPAIAILGFVFVMSIVAGMIATGEMWEGATKTIHANLLWMSSAMGALGLIALIPRTHEHHERLIRSYVMVCGYLVPLFLIVISLFPNQIGAIVGWEHDFAASGTGDSFIRGFTPIGGPISSGILILFAVGLSISQVLKRQSRWFYGPVIAIGTVAITFTLSRSVAAASALFLLLYFASAIRTHWKVAFPAVLAAVLVVGGIVYYMSQHYDLSRFTNLEDTSYNLRASSVPAAVNAWTESPILGHGPGVLYSDVRMPSSLRGGEDAPKYTYIGNELTALEPHNLYLLLLAEYGAVGLLVFLVVAYLIARRLRMTNRIAGSSVMIAKSYFCLFVAFAFFEFTHSTILLYTKFTICFWPFIFMALHHSEMVESQADEYPIYADGESGDLEQYAVADYEVDGGYVA